MVQVFSLARTVATAVILRNIGVVTVAPLTKDGRAMGAIPLRTSTAIATPITVDRAIQLTLHTEVVINKTTTQAIIRSTLTHKPATPSNILTRFNTLLPPRNVASVQRED